MTGPEPGPLGEEAARLVQAVRDWAARTFPDTDRHLATGAEECRYCPLCQAIAALRGERPEVTERLAGVVTAAAGALAAVAEALTQPPATRRASPPSRRESPGPADTDRPRPRMHPIRVEPAGDGED